MIVKRRTRGTNGIRPARLAEVSFQLHYAQTQRQSRCQIYTTTTWDYTTLKRRRRSASTAGGFTTTWDYTTLKLGVQEGQALICFTTTWDYTTLKRHVLVFMHTLGFTTTWDYTTLKPRCGIGSPPRVLLPLGITLLSNNHSRFFLFLCVLLPLGITLLSNLKFQNGRYFVRKNGKTRRFPTVWSSTPTLQQSIRRQQNDYST